MSLKNPKKCDNCDAILGRQKNVKVLCHDCSKKLKLQDKHELAGCMCKDCSQKIESIIQNKKAIARF